MPLFKVTASKWVEEVGELEIEAHDAEDAMAQVNDEDDWNWSDGSDSKDFEVTGAEEIEEGVDLEETTEADGEDEKRMTTDEEMVPNTSEGITITVFSMKNIEDGDSIIAEKGEAIAFYDIVVRDANLDWIDGEEDLTHPKEIEETLEYFQIKYPNASVEYEP